MDQVFNAAKSGMRGVLGIEPTLSALVEEKVRMLLIAEGLAIDGSVCPRCDYFSAQEFKNVALLRRRGTEGYYRPCRGKGYSHRSGGGSRLRERSPKSSARQWRLGSALEVLIF